MRRTNIVVDDKLVDEAKRLTGIKTLRALVDAGVRELVARERRRRILRLRGRVAWEGDLTTWRDER